MVAHWKMVVVPPAASTPALTDSATNESVSSLLDGGYRVCLLTLGYMAEHGVDIIATLGVDISDTGACSWTSMGSVEAIGGSSVVLFAVEVFSGCWEPFAGC